MNTRYTLAIRVFQFPPCTRRLQSPKHHLSSYKMSSHGVWEISIPIFLRQWLRPEHVNDTRSSVLLLFLFSIF
ncbi:hypothetical protein F5Y02DRAFT_370545 [Annulohypoxylon stygium]|nr:hypothetical protein F5Y02DRAFT_370545 [Annulohypoxylon stygium]